MSTDNKQNLPAKQEETKIAPKRVGQILADHLRMEPTQMIAVMKAQCFSGTSPDRITNEQLAAYCNVALSLKEQCPGFNPLLPGMLYAFPTSNGGIQPMIGPDGIYAMLASRSDIDWYKAIPEFDTEGKLIAARGLIKCKDRSEPFEYRAYLSEWEVKKNPNWNTRPVHMLCLRAMKQCARFIIHGIPLDREEQELIDTPYEEIKTEAKQGGSRSAALARALPASPRASIPTINTEAREAEQEAIVGLADEVSRGMGGVTVESKPQPPLEETSPEELRGLYAAYFRSIANETGDDPKEVETTMLRFKLGKLNIAYKDLDEAFSEPKYVANMRARALELEKSDPRFGGNV